MSCPCPSGYTPTIDSDSCILTITAATSGGSFFYTGVAATDIVQYNKLGVIFYEDITSLSYPISNSGSTGNVTTQNGTPLFNTEFLLDNSGRILNIQAGGVGTGINNDGTYGPTSITNSLWGLGTINSGRLNNAGIWASTGNPAPPINEYIGFSYCLDIATTDTYYIGLSADNDIRLKVNNETLVDCKISNFTANTQALSGYSIIFVNHHVFPVTLTSGLNIIELEGLNTGAFAAFCAEVYTGSVATLSGYTSYSQLSANTIFSTLDFIGQNIPLSSSGATTGTGYTCPSGYSLYTCSGSPYCIYIDKTDIVNYCVQDTGLGYDDNYIYGGTQDAYPYWSGETTGKVIYFSTSEGTWCLANTLLGACLLAGPYPCSSTCPDLCDTYVFSGACPTPTPTPTINCSVLDFTAIFDCEVTPTPSVTPTISVTPTVTPTPTSSDPCGGRAVSVTISGYTPTPTPTISVTPTLTPEVTRPCAVSGTVTFNSVIGLLECPSSKKFQDCVNGTLYYAVNPIVLPSGGTLTQYDIFKADINGVSKCVTFLGIELDVIGYDSIDITDGPLGSSTATTCNIVCTPNVSQTPTVTPTPTITPTISVTPTPSVAVGYYVYQRCTIPTEYIIQTLPGPTFMTNQVFSTTGSTYFGECWKFISYSSTYPTLPLGSTSSFLLGNTFVNNGATFYTSCNECSFVVGDSGVS